MSDQPHETILQVEGMTCPSCIRHVSIALTELDGVRRVDVQLRAGTVVVNHDAREAPIASLIEALGDAGYAARPRAL